MSKKNQETTGTPAIWTMGMSGNDPDYLVFLWQPPGYAGQGNSNEEVYDAEGHPGDEETPLHRRPRRD